MARSLAIISEFHYGYRRGEQSAKAEGYRELQNWMSESLWSGHFLLTDLESRHFDVIYAESVCSPVQAWRFGKVFRRMKSDEIEKDNLRNQYIHRLVSKGAKFRITENVFWFNVHRLYRAFGGKDKETEYRLADKRDNFIARNIANTLRDGESAVLIAGAAHEPEKYLAKVAPDIKLDLRFKFTYPK